MTLNIIPVFSFGKNCQKVTQSTENSILSQTLLKTKKTKKVAEKQQKTVFFMRVWPHLCLRVLRVPLRVP